MTRKPTKWILLSITPILSAIIIVACNSSSAANAENISMTPSLPVVAVQQMPATVYQEYSASLEGSKGEESTHVLSTLSFYPAISYPSMKMS